MDPDQQTAISIYPSKFFKGDDITERNMKYTAKNILNVQFYACMKRRINYSIFDMTPKQF